MKEPNWNKWAEWEDPINKLARNFRAWWADLSGGRQFVAVVTVLTLSTAGYLVLKPDELPARTADQAPGTTWYDDSYEGEWYDGDDSAGHDTNTSFNDNFHPFPDDYNGDPNNWQHNNTNDKWDTDLDNDSVDDRWDPDMDNDGVHNNYDLDSDTDYRD